MTDAEHAEKILDLATDLIAAVNEAEKDGLAVKIEPVRIALGRTSFSVDVKRITPIAHFP